jgi:chemotaxis protein CheX
MDANVLNQFILATDVVFQQVANISLKKEKVNMFEGGHKFVISVATIIGFTGALKGQLIVGIDESMAQKFASAIMMGLPVEEFNEIAESGVCEMANMIGGESLRRLSDIGLVCDLSVPSLVRGQRSEISFTPNSPLFAVDFSCDWGPVLLVMRYEVAK